MELVFFTSVTMLCSLLSTLLAPACVHSLHIQVRPSTELAAAKGEVQVSQLHALPRKLRVAETQATVVGQQNQVSSSAPDHNMKQKQNVLSAGTKPLIHEKEQVMHKSSAGTMPERREGDDEDVSAFFTMDYSKVRRRRPIHNKFGVAVTAATP